LEAVFIKYLIEIYLWGWRKIQSILFLKISIYKVRINLLITASFYPLIHSALSILTIGMHVLSQSGILGYPLFIRISVLIEALPLLSFCDVSQFL
jgi:hypothetical protein